jgi:hypothetical protein
MHAVSEAVPAPVRAPERTHQPWRMKRAVVFTGDLAYSVRKGTAELISAFPGSGFGILAFGARLRGISR